MINSLKGFHVDITPHEYSNTSQCYSLSKMTTPPKDISVTKHNAIAGEQSTQYVPNEKYDVICGRGKGIFNKPGNRKLRAIASNHVQEYINAKSKLDKSFTINKIHEAVKAQNNGKTRFVKKEKSGNYVIISDDNARDKVAHVMRDLIAADSKRRRPVSGMHSPKSSRQDIRIDNSVDISASLSNHVTASLNDISDQSINNHSNVAAAIDSDSSRSRGRLGRFHSTEDKSLQWLDFEY